MPRQREVAACRRKLLTPVEETVAIWGMGGSGKSVLANAVARDESVRKRFRDGVFWVGVGQDDAGQEAKAMALQAYLGSLLLGESPRILSAQQGKDYARKLLSGKACLIILDDVWDIRDVQWLQVAGPQSRILLTTREGGPVSALGATEYRLGRLTERQAATLLERWSGKSIHGDAKAQEVARECGFLPLALAVCGAMARDGASWKAIATGLKSADISFLKQPGIDPVLKSIQASIDYLVTNDEDAAGLYLSLAVFVPTGSIPEVVVTMLWEQVKKCPQWKTEIRLGMLERKSLLTLQGDAPRRSISLHDLHQDFIVHKCENLENLHNQVVYAYRSRLSKGWSSGPDDGYFFENLERHMREAGRFKELEELALDRDWQNAKQRTLRNTITLTLDRSIQDYTNDEQDKVLSALKDLLRISGDIVVKNIRPG